MKKLQHPYNIYIEQNPENIEEIKSVFNGEAFSRALNNLSSAAFAMYIYLSMEQSGKYLRMCKPDFFNKFSYVNDSQYYRAMQELITVGYMKRDEKTGFYNFNPNAEIEPIKKERMSPKKKILQKKYPDIIIPRTETTTMNVQELIPNEWYILPINSKKRGDIHNVYFCRCLGADLKNRIFYLVKDQGGVAVKEEDFYGDQRYAYQLFLNRAIPMNFFDNIDVLQKVLPDNGYALIKDDDPWGGTSPIPWQGAEISNQPELCKRFEEMGINLGAIILERYIEQNT